MSSVPDTFYLDSVIEAFNRDEGVLTTTPIDEVNPIPEDDPEDDIPKYTYEYMKKYNMI